MSKCHVGSVHELRDRVRSFLISSESPYYRERKSFHSYSVNNRGLQTSVSPSESPICEIVTRNLAKKGGNEANQRRKYWETKQCVCVQWIGMPDICRLIRVPGVSLRISAAIIHPCWGMNLCGFKRKHWKSLKTWVGESNQLKSSATLSFRRMFSIWLKLCGRRVWPMTISWIEFSCSWIVYR